jgi:hypothetical protein
MSACLMGSKDFYPFRTSNLKLSFRKAAEMFACHADAPPLKFDGSNSFQKAGEGMFWEAVLASSLIVASRLNGVQGILLKDFIPSVFAQIQLSDELVDFNLGDTENESLKIFMNSFIVPFLSPPNQQWPGFVKDIPNSNFGNLSLTINKGRIELNSDFGLTGEVKNIKEKIGIDEMDKILNRIHERNGMGSNESKVHIVFVDSLIGFIQSSKQSFDLYKKYCCVKVEVDSQVERFLHLRDIPGLSKISDFDFNDESTLVVFYELKTNKIEQEESNIRKQAQVTVGKEMKLKR